MAGSSDPGSAIHIGSDVALVGGQERSSRVDAHPHPNGGGGEGRLCVDCGGECTGRRRKGDEERVALGVHFHPALGGKRLTDDPPMLSERSGIILGSQSAKQTRRTLDVGEQKGHSATRQVLRHRSESHYAGRVARRVIAELLGDKFDD